MIVPLRIGLLWISLFLLGPFPVFGTPHQAHTAILETIGMESLVHLVATKPKKTPARSSALVTNLRFHKHPEFTRLVLDLPSPIKFIERHHKKAQRVTIQLKGSTLSKKARAKLKEKKFPRGVRFTQSRTGSLTVTLDLRTWTTYRVNFLRDPHRLVLDLYYSPNGKGPPSQGRKTPSDQVLPPPAQTQPRVKAPQDLIVVIDPGHGGRDPGAIGRKGTKEKDITLKIAKNLRDLIRKRLGARVLLTRSKDVFLNLERRAEFANNKKADLFISIHANSHTQKRVRGLELYHFGKASDPRALEVAARENGMPLDDNAPAWQFILADKLNDQKIDQSMNFAYATREALVQTLRRDYRVKDHGVKTAPFYVLRYTTMPSLLAEVAFLSNSTDENRLRSSSFRHRLAEGIFYGIQTYFKNHPPLLP